MMLKYYYRGEGRGGIERVSRSLQVGVIDLFIRCWRGSRLILEATLVFATDIVFSTPPLFFCTLSICTQCVFFTFFRDEGFIIQL